MEPRNPQPPEDILGPCGQAATCRPTDDRSEARRSVGTPLPGTGPVPPRGTPSGGIDAASDSDEDDDEEAEEEEDEQEDEEEEEEEDEEEEHEIPGSVLARGRNSDEEEGAAAHDRDLDPEDAEDDDYGDEGEDDDDEDEEEEEEDYAFPRRIRRGRAQRLVSSESEQHDTSGSEALHVGTRSSRAEIVSRRASRAVHAGDDDDDDSSDESEENEVHPSVTCDGCGRGPPLFGQVMKCQECEDFDFCARCYAARSRYGHDPEHRFQPRRAAGTRARRSEALLHFLEDEMLQEALRRSTQEEEGPAEKEQKAAEQAAAILARLSRVPWTAPARGGEDEDGAQECAMCLEEYTQGEEVVKLDCDHQFHEKCLSPWLRKSPLCPLCRHDLSA